MSEVTAALEAGVAIVLASMPLEGARQTSRERVMADRAFAQILKLIAPRIRKLIRQYGLVAHWDDAEQVCAIGVHRAILAYDPNKALFTTFVNWQLRGELQALRFRLMDDQRRSVRKIGATMVSLHAGIAGGDGKKSTLEATIVDEQALELTEAGASSYLAATTQAKLIEEYTEHLRIAGIDQLQRRTRRNSASKRLHDPTLPRLKSGPCPDDLAALEERIARHRHAMVRRLGDDGSTVDTTTDDGEGEKLRQVAKRATVAMIELVERAPRFADILVVPCPRRHIRNKGVALRA